jgi:hypothetical protein
MTSTGRLGLLATTILAAGMTVTPDQPTVVAFPPTEARFVRFLIHASRQGQPCIDELEVYGPRGEANLALASAGAKASASSCLPGYAIHQVAHLNDGLYGNDHSWIAAGRTDEWAQIELPRKARVARVVFSRDRRGQYRDRVPETFEVQVSLDGSDWTTVARGGPPVPPDGPLPNEELLRYAFACERRTSHRVDPSPPLERVLGQLEAMIGRFAARGLDVSKERRHVAALRGRGEALAASGATAEERDAVFFEARLAKRRLFFRDPDLAGIGRILFVKRHPFEPSHNYSVLLDAPFRPGGGVCVLEIPRRNGRFEPADATATCLFDAGGGIARTAMASFDARTLWFAYRPSADGTFHLMVMDADGRNVRQRTEGPFHDFWPCPLPDGGVAFISTRCKARFLCWRPQAFVLFRMEADGSRMRPLSFANLSEWAPSVMADGRILWTRSEYLDKGADFGHTLWAVRPDGAHPELVFGNNTRHCYANGREVPGTGEICCTLISHGGDLNGPIAFVDVRKGRFNPAAVTNITPDVAPRYHMDWARAECFRDPVPLSRDTVLVSHAPHDRFGLYVIDRFGNREVLYLDPTTGSMCPTPLGPVPAPPVIPPVAETGAEAPACGRFTLVDVYRGLEPEVSRGTVKYLRVCQEVRADLERLPSGGYRRDHQPFQDFYASPTHKVRGPHGWPSYVAKGTLGIVPVAEDGSASFYAPAGKVLYFQVLDADFNEIQRMRSVVQLQPGEQRGCIGCHEDRSSVARARRTAAMQQPPRTLRPPPWGAGPFSYRKVVQPVWDAHCVRCHNADHPKQFDLTGALDADRVPASYRTLIAQGWVHYFDYTWGREHAKARPLTFGSVRSKLWKVLETGHHDVRLTREDRRRVQCWIDLNCPLWPDYRFRPDRPAGGTDVAGR